MRLVIFPKVSVLRLTAKDAHVTVEGAKQTAQSDPKTRKLYLPSGLRQSRMLHLYFKIVSGKPLICRSHDARAGRVDTHHWAFGAPHQNIV